MPMSSAIIAMTTSSSIRVNPLRLLLMMRFSVRESVSHAPASGGGSLARVACLDVLAGVRPEKDARRGVDATRVFDLKREGPHTLGSDPIRGRLLQRDVAGVWAWAYQSGGLEPANECVRSKYHAHGAAGDTCPL